MPITEIVKAITQAMVCELALTGGGKRKGSSSGEQYEGEVQKT